MDKKEKVAELLMTTGHAHHQAFIKTDGVDPDWASWYGTHLEEPLSKIIGSELSATDITAKLVLLDKEFNAQSPSEHWTIYYTNEFAKLGVQKK